MVIQVYLCGDGTIFDLDIDVLLQNIFKTNNKCIPMYTNLPMCCDADLKNSIVPVKITNNATDIQVMTNYISSKITLGKQSTLLRTNDKLYSSTISNGANIYYGVRPVFISSKTAGTLTDLDTNIEYNICDFVMPTNYGVLTSKYTDSSIPTNYPICLIGNDGNITSVNINRAFAGSGYTISTRLYLKDNILFVILGNGKSTNTSPNKYKILVYEIGDNSITKLAESNTYKLTSKYSNANLSCGIAFDKDSGNIHIGCGFYPSYDILGYTNGTFTLEHNNVPNCPYASSGKYEMKIGILDTVQDKILCLTTAQNGSIGCVSIDYSTSYSVTYKGISSSNYWDIFPGNKIYILDNPNKIAATYTFDYDTNTITFTPTNEQGNAITYANMYYYDNTYPENSGGILEQFVYLPDNVAYDINTKKLTEYISVGYTISEKTGMNTIYLEPCEWSDTNLCGILLKNDTQSHYTILSLNKNAKSILDQYYTNNNILSSNYKGTISPTEYNAALNTANQIKGGIE